MIRTLQENLKSGGAILAGQRWLIQLNKKRKRTGRNQKGERGRWRMRCAGAANPSLTRTSRNQKGTRKFDSQEFPITC